MKIISEGKSLIKAWIDHVPIEDEAIQQLKNIAELPFIFKHVAVMPDAHSGKGSTVGTVIATKGAIIPAAVGVDIGCGMMAVKTTLTTNDLPENLDSLRSSIEAAIPHGRTDNGGKNDKGAWNSNENRDWVTASHLTMKFINDYQKIVSKHPKANHHRHPIEHLGTLGTGNHFIEICLDEEQNVWVMLHSGSRGIGNRIGSYFIEKAKEEMQRYHIDKFLSDSDLSYLVEHTEIYDDYVFAVDWAQQYARINRELMMEAVIEVMKQEIKIPFVTQKSAINCHHNYVERENHFGSNVLVTRKGAVRARKGDLGIIPGSMGAKSFIVRGLGNPESFHSCSHGAGRVMSRTQARKQFTVEDHIADTQGVNCRKDVDVIDETPKAYKNIEDVMRSQEDLIEIVATLKQVLCVKG